MRVLVAYGSKRGGTAGLAEMIAEEMSGIGLDATASPARDVRSIDGYDAVVVAGALYAFRWHRDARRLVHRFADELRQRPVWMVSSGPLDESAATGEIPPVRHVVKAMTAVGARGHMTFGGRLEPDAKGFPASAMAKKHSGDWRDRDQVRRWVATIAPELLHLDQAA